jgi:hypothetical protein
VICGTGYVPLNQSWEWGEAKRLTGSSVARYQLGDRLGVQLEWRRGLAWAPAAPVGETTEQTARQLDDLARLLRRPILLSPTAHLPGGAAPFATGLFHSGTVLFDISGGVDPIRGRFRKTWRNSLSKAMRADTEIADGTLDEFMPMLDELTMRKGFELSYDDRFIRIVLSVFGEGARLRLARLGETVVGGWLDLRSGSTVTSFLSATTLEGRSVNSAYLLAWDALVRHYVAGATVYDLGGISGERATGPSAHKLSMGGEVLNFPGTYVIGVGPRTSVVKALLRVRARRARTASETPTQSA